ncbi:MAG: C40 family peptidase [Bacteriovoracaceae bacterium]|nr:C40 family peptidase [Bacteriovoracaceae bacterium]
MKYLAIIIFLFTINARSDCDTNAPCLEFELLNEEQFVPRPIIIKESYFAETTESEVIEYAKKHIGIPYQYGGNNLSGIDCSAFVQKLFQKKNISLPRTSRQQFQDSRFTDVAIEDLQSEDLVYFTSPGKTYINHVALYIGNGKIIHSSRREGGVQISEILFSNFWAARFFAARRLNIN